MSDLRARIVIKLRALLAKTTANGCTEEEAMAAAAKASELMEEYDLSYTDVEQVRDERYGARRRPFAGGSYRRRTHHEVSMCHGAIADFATVRCWYSGSDLIFFGSETDTETAHALSDMIMLSMNRECAAFQRSADRDPNVHGRSTRAAFMMGMANRVASRLREMKRLRDGNVQAKATATGATGTALVLVEKGKVVEAKYNQHLRDQGIKIRSGGAGRSFNGQSGAYNAGQRAGDRVALNPALGGARKAIA